MSGSTLTDHIFLFAIILPQLLLTLRYLTSPAAYRYKSNLNALLVPSSVLVFFYFESFDVLYLAIFTMICGVLVTWRMMDPDDTSWLDYYRQFGLEDVQSYT